MSSHQQRQQQQKGDHADEGRETALEPELDTDEQAPEDAEPPAPIYLHPPVGGPAPAAAGGGAR